MNFLEALANFKTWAIEVIPKLIKKNRELREEIRSIIGELADELITGLNLVARRLRVSKRIHEPKELASYLSESERQLHDTFKEFHVCRGLRDLEDRFNRFFDNALYIGQDAGITYLNAPNAYPTGSSGIQNC